MTQADAVLIQNLSKRYEASGESREILKGVTLTAARGKSLAIMGPSGCGKSTLLNIIGTLDTPSGGSVALFGTDPFKLNETELARFRNASIGFVFQAHHLLPQCSVLENVLLPTIIAPAAEREQTAARAQRLLERVGLTHRLHARPGQLSGGECQRAAVVRALINSPRLLLADEPTGSLDEQSADMIGTLLTELNREEKFALIVVTHSPELAKRMDERFRLIDGRLIAQTL